MLRAERKTECHKLKDDKLIEHLTLVSETGSHSDSLSGSDSSGGTNDSEQSATPIILQQRKKKSRSHLLQWIITTPNCTNK